MKLEIIATWVPPVPRRDDWSFPVKIEDYQKGAGVVYLIHFDGRLKIGSTTNPSTRVRTHCNALRKYGITVDAVYISRPMTHHILAEIQIHRQMEEFLIPQAREIFRCDPMDVIRDAEIGPFKYYGMKKVLTPVYAMLRADLSLAAVA